jgi:hypothetical protein
MAKTLHIGDRGPEVERLQRAVNGIVGMRRFPWRKIDVDEIFGDETQKGARFAGWLMGFSRPGTLAQIRDGTITARAVSILARERPPTEAMKRRIEIRRPKAKELRILHRPRPIQPMHGVAIFHQPHAPAEEDRKIQVASWMVRFLKKSRERGWDGHVISGFRSPQESTAVCMRICGRPTCSSPHHPCAGANSNHSGRIHPAGAIDINVETALEFAAIQRRIGSPLKNDMPLKDPNHFSVSGH